MVRKLLGVVVMVLGLIFSASCAETKDLRLDGKFVVELPELAPDFSTWGGQLVGVESFENGNAVAILQVRNEDQSVVVNLLLVRVKEAAYIVGMAVFYINTARVEYLEDRSFMTTGQPSRKLEYVKEPSKMDQIKMLLNQRGI